MGKEISVFKTRVTEILGIEYPIICGGFGTVSQVKLAAAVSNAGGFGIIASAYHRTPEALREVVFHHTRFLPLVLP